MSKSKSSRFNQLNANTLHTLPAGVHNDSPGLSLEVVADGDYTDRFWTFRYTSPVTGKRTEWRLGYLQDKSLADVREEARQHRNAVAAGRCPKSETKVKRRTDIPTFLDYANQTYPVLASNCVATELGEWKRAIADVAPLHKLPINEVTVTALAEALLPHWTTKYVSATRIKARVARIINAAKADGLFTGDNPADLVEHKLPKVKHRPDNHASLDWQSLPTLMVGLYHDTYVSARCLEVGILCASRSNEVRGMEWSEVDFDAGVWTVPADRMKTRLEHRVPLSRQVLAILRELRQIVPEGCKYVFPSKYGRGQPLERAALTYILRSRHAVGTTQHGFRATFKTWATDNKVEETQIVEFCLAHVDGNKARAAYLRSDLIERRRAVLQAWADYALSKRPGGAQQPAETGNVVQLRKAA